MSNDNKSDGFSSTNIIFFYSKNEINLDFDKLSEKMRQYTGEIELINKTFFHKEFLIDEFLPSSIIMDYGKAEPKIDEVDLSQVWDFNEVEEVLSECKYCISLAQMLIAARLDYKQRNTLTRNVMKAILETHHFDLIYFQTTGTIVSPHKFLENFNDPLFGIANVRFFNINYSDGLKRMLMDTRGLSFFGTIPDLQVQFSKLDPNKVFSYLYGMMHYVYDNGDIIKDNETSGPTINDRWICTHQYSAVEPTRHVIDIDPNDE